MKKYHCFVDGGCYDNGGMNASAYGSYHIYDTTDMDYPTVDLLIPITPVLQQMRFPISEERRTNNVAEARAMHLLLQTLLAQKYLNAENRITIYSDSQLIINQLKGIYATKDRHLFRIHQDTYRVLQKWENKFNVVPNELLSLERIPGTEMKKVLGH